MSLLNKVQQFLIDSDLAHKIVHGDASTEVQTEGGPVRSFAKLMADSIGFITSFGKPEGSGLIGHGASTVKDALDEASSGLKALQLADYDALRAYAGPRQSVYITGYLVTAAPSGIAGLFVRDDKDTASVDNGGTVIVAANGTRWKRDHGSPVNLRWFGTKGDGVVEDTAGFTAAVTNATVGSTVFLQPRTYLLKDAFNKTVELEGSKGTVLKAAPGAARVLSLGRHVTDWNYHRVSGLTFDGNAKSAYCIDFNDNVANAAAYGGRWVFDRVRFQNGSVGVYAKTGNIGNTYRNCHMIGNDYGMRLTTEGSAGTMHAGCTVVEASELSNNAKAAVYINDATDGGGQYDFNNVIVESNPGFGLFIKLNNITPYAGITFRNFWEEANATAATVNIDGVDYAPRAIYIENARPVIFEGSYLKDVKMVNSTVLARHCRIDSASTKGLKLDVDATSQLIVENLYANGGQSSVPFVRSILSQAGSNANSNYSVRGPFKTWRTNPNGTVLLKQNYDGAGPWPFSGTGTVNATSVADGVIGSTCAELVIPTGFNLLNPAFFTPTQGKWVVWGVHFKLQAGAPLAQASFNYNSRLGDIYQRAVGEWVCSYGIQYIGTAFNTVTTYFSNTSGAPTTIRLADVFVVQFDTMEAAYAFVNSGAAVR